MLEQTLQIMQYLLCYSRIRSKCLTVKKIFGLHEELPPLPQLLSTEEVNLTLSNLTPELGTKYIECI